MSALYMEKCRVSSKQRIDGQSFELSWNFHNCIGAMHRWDTNSHVSALPSVDPTTSTIKGLIHSSASPGGSHLYILYCDVIPMEVFSRS